MSSYVAIFSRFELEYEAEPFCDCYKNAVSSEGCPCGEENIVLEWSWELPPESASRWLSVSKDKKRVTFHPSGHSCGTAIARGDTPLLRGNQYYWEVKILTSPYGTNVMLGVGNMEVNISEPDENYLPILGKDSNSYGLTCEGIVRHSNQSAHENFGFCQGTIVGVRLDLWHGTLEFYLNRNPQGISFFDMRRHSALYPMISSTAARMSMRLMYASSWHASLLVDAAKILAASEKDDLREQLPPGLRFILDNEFWLTLPRSEPYKADD